jgi:transposase InsO family protein
MEADWAADRAELRLAIRDHPRWSVPQLAQQLGRSVSWVKKWRQRLRAAPADDETVLHSRSRARKHPPPGISQRAIERILAIRDEPPANLQRVPGPRAILYFLRQDPELQAAGVAPPRSSATVWQVLRRHGRIPQRRRSAHEPWDLPPPLTSWQIDFKDVSTVPSEPLGKRQHGVEALNCVDCGTSLLVAADVRADFTEETTLTAVADLLQAHGRPVAITLDRDPRFVGAPGAGDFPSPLIRFLTCLGIVVHVNPPHRPDLNAFVERYHGTYDRECLKVHRPATLEQAREVTAAFQRHYNAERPNQARSCGNRPPRVAFPELPPCPPLPMLVDTDAWLPLIDGRRYVRQVQTNGTVEVEHTRYYIGRRLAGQRVALAVVAAERSLVVYHGDTPVKQLPLGGLRREILVFDRYVALMQREARAEARRHHQHHHRLAA